MGRRSGGGRGTLSLGCYGVRGRPSEDGAPCGVVGVVCCCGINCYINRGIQGMIVWIIPARASVGMPLPEQRFRWFPGSRSMGTTGVSTTSKVPSVIFGRVCLDCRVAEVAIHITLGSTC
ncbi:hypothetical protein B296_00019273 [Ensete ventricosum]|uniref:Uncharacterized protein n=1 Tax=Ensete ventricosum TaxID=4639 RepID=A0A427ACN3_ENSVE|nr:hypothetical protein B296_00019273 [Ensete ventricosum]